MSFRFLSLLFSIPLCGSLLTDQLRAQDTSAAPGHVSQLTLAQALQRVADRNPELAFSELEIQAAAARVAQAGVRPNPQFEATAENLSFPLVGDGFLHYAESTLQVSQRLELGNKRSLRIRAAENEVAVARSEFAVKRVELMYAASLAFAEALAAQERLANQQELNRLAQQSYATVVERVAAGKVSPVEQTRAAVALASSQIEAEKHKRALIAAKDWLASLWGGSSADFDQVLGRFAIPPVAVNLGDSCLQNNPEVRLAAAASDARGATLALEQANRRPDLTFSAGLRRLSLDQQQVWVTGISVPIPIFDKRQGTIAEARVRLEQAREAEKAVTWRLSAALTQARHEHENALLEAGTLRESALPAAREAAAAVEEGYRLGKFDFLNVLDAQRTYAELQGKYIEAVASGLKATLVIERLARCDSPAELENLIR